MFNLQVIVGVDPGKLGAYAVMIGGKLVRVIPFKGNPDICRSLFHEFKWTVCVFIIETVTASPQMGVVSAFTFGKYADMVETSAILTGNQVIKVRPQVWQEYLNCLSGGDKEVLYRKARSLFPEEHKTKLFNKQSADAVLIAYYGHLRLSR